LLNGAYATTFVQAFQGSATEGTADYGHYLGVAATCKHFAGYSLETNRFASNAEISVRAVSVFLSRLDSIWSYLTILVPTLLYRTCTVANVWFNDAHRMHWIAYRFMLGVTSLHDDATARPTRPATWPSLICPLSRCASRRASRRRLCGTSSPGNTTHARTCVRACVRACVRPHAHSLLPKRLNLCTFIPLGALALLHATPVLTTSNYPATTCTCVHSTHIYHTTSAYNEINGVPACLDEHLINGLARDRWGFEGLVVSDQDAIKNAYSAQHYCKTQAQCSALGIKAGCDQNDGPTYANSLAEALAKSLLNVSDLDVVCRSVWFMRLFLFLFLFLLLFLFLF
jgi:hypothetical protein